MSTLNVGAIDFSTGVAIKSQAVNPQTGTTYTFVESDAGTLVSASSASAVTFTIPPQSSVSWGDNTVLKVVNYGAGVLTVNGGSGVTVTNTATTVAQYSSAAAIRTAENAWTLVPFSGGVSAANFSDAATGTYTDGGGISYKYKTYTGSGTLTVTKAGLADILVVGGGGGGSEGSNRIGGGGAGAVRLVNIELAVATYTLTVGGGGAAGGFVGSTGVVSSFGTLVTSGGGGGGVANPRSADLASNNAAGGGHAGGVFVNISSTGSRKGMGAGTAASPNESDGYTSTITNTSYIYGIGGISVPSSNYGSGGWTGNGIAGVIVVRVRT